MFYNRNLRRSTMWEKCKNSIKTALMQIVIFRYFSTTAVVLMAFVLCPSIVA